MNTQLFANWANTIVSVCAVQLQLSNSAMYGYLMGVTFIGSRTLQSGYGYRA